MNPTTGMSDGGASVFLPRGKIMASPYIKITFRFIHVIILPLHGKAATGGFFAYFEP